MNVTDKLDLDGMLNDWPAPAHEEAVWEARADRIVEKALSLRAEGAAAPIDLLAVPDLAPEPGEAQTGDFSREAPAVGEHSIMAYGSDGGGAEKPEASLPGGTSRPAERKRPSLKEIAERASQSSGRVSGVPGLSSSGISTPLPPGRSSATATPLPSSGRNSATATPLPSGRSSGISTPLPPSGRGSMPPGRVSTAPGRSSAASGFRASSPSLRPGEASGEDSGVIDLNRLSASANPEQAEATQQAQPGADPSEDNKPAEAAVVSARAPRAAAVQPAAARGNGKKSSGGMIAGAAIAALGLAAAVTMMLRTKDAPREETAATQVALAPAAPAAETAPAKPAPAPQEPAVPAAASPPPEQGEPAAAAEKLAAAPKAAPQGAAAAHAPAAPEAPAAAPKADQGKTAAAPAAPGNPGDLSSAMQAAVGSDGAQKPSVESEAPEPASGPLRQQNIPEQPSQGSVQAALGSVMGTARACVAGADDVTRAQLTFSSSGQVTKVSVSGWAAANGQSSCVQAAFKGANVGPFSKPSFSVSATVRP
ncbi:hypothetical protein SOCE26_101420 [Sorangium cellulosum]|uniref:Uncharacterized protein n=1 Tax=Sorangium cellulosum TaxID=56 RepID=A0A2L0FAN2_SORCE|nr:hypothetical protein [Sorangium cellulosum]AUX48603.1 hypothetical protein SOCE26_101420 [Sorangium cellulosum]